MRSHSQDEQSQYIDALKMSDQDHQQLLSELDRGATTVGRDKRRSKRIPYRGVRGLVLQVTHPGGTTVRFLVKPRNISKSGLSVLHGGFIHPGTPCATPLRNLRGQSTVIRGEVVSCRHIRGRVHEIGIRFDQMIPVQQFVFDADLDDGAGPISLPTLAGRVLVVDEWADDRKLLAYDLQKLGLTVEEADGGADAIRKAGTKRYDVVVMGEWLGDMAAADLAANLRRSGVTTPLLGVFADGADQAAVKATANGVATVVTKPYKVESLANLLLQFLQLDASGATRGGSPDLSEKWIEAGMRPMILAFLQGLEIRLGDLESQLFNQGGGGDPVQTCTRLRAAAASYGFPRISEAAEELSRLVDAQASLDQLKLGIDKLAALASNSLRVTRTEAERG